MYPGGLRQDSSNYDPIQAWNFGVQLVALNYQNNDESMALCYGKFLDNGGCGYILKPNYLLRSNENHFNPLNPTETFDKPMYLNIQILSGQFLPRSKETSKDIPDVYVRMSIHGLACDEKSQQTKVIDNNGFDPIWNETFQFHIRFPQLALVYFAVMDHDPLSSDDRLAYFSCPITLIQSGYRHIHLRANNNDPIHSTLFVHIDIRYENTDTTLHTRI